MTKVTSNTTHIIAYYRVSTKKQGASGLGLDAQKSAVNSYATAHGLTITAEFTEIETGTNKAARPEISRAIEAAKTSGGRLVIAKLDRLARNVTFISALMDSGIDFVACDMPDANRLTIHIMAAMAEHEAHAISARTKAALDAKRARDGEWRVSQLDDDARAKSAETRQQMAAAHNAPILRYAQLMKNYNFSLNDIARRLNEDGFRTIRGNKFSAMTVKRLLE